MDRGQHSHWIEKEMEVVGLAVELWRKGSCGERALEIKAGILLRRC